MQWVSLDLLRSWSLFNLHPSVKELPVPPVLPSESQVASIFRASMCSTPFSYISHLRTLVYAYDKELAVTFLEKGPPLVLSHG